MGMRRIVCSFSKILITILLIICISNICSNNAYAVTSDECEESGHNFGDEPTHVIMTSCVLQSMEIYECSRCGHLDERYVKPVGHKYEVIIKRPGLFIEGKKYKVCQKCGDEQLIAKLPAKYPKDKIMIACLPIILIYILGKKYYEYRKKNTKQWYE